MSFSTHLEFLDIFLFENKGFLSNYADDNILHASGSYICLSNIAVCVYKKDTIYDKQTNKQCLWKSSKGNI